MSVHVNEAISTIFQRRSCRGFKDEQIGEEELELVLKCGLSAPSAMNTQSWHFTVIQNHDLISWINSRVKDFLSDEKISQLVKTDVDIEDYSIFYNSPTVILVSSSEEDLCGKFNCSFATQNICIAAESLGMSTCIVGLASLLFKSEQSNFYRAELGIPSGYECVFGIAIGYRDVEPVIPTKLPGKVFYIK